MSPKAKAVPRGSAAGQPKELGFCKAWSRRRTSRWRTCSAINNPQTSAWPAGLRSRWCLPPFPPCRPCPWKLRQDGRYGLSASRRGGIAGQCRSPGSHCSGQLVRRAAVGAGDDTAMRTIRHQPRGLRQRTCTILKKLIQHHTHCHHHSTRRDSESLQAELAGLVGSEAQAGY